MVFTVAEEPTESDQVPVVKGKQRKSVASGRKNKAVVSSSSPSKVKESPTKTGAKNSSKADLLKPCMGNTSAQSTSSASHDDHKIMDEVTSASTSNHNVDALPESNNNGDNSVSSDALLEAYSTFQEFEDLDCESNTDDAKSQTTRLKTLLLLQVSLISRQQDLLRLRDREIMQLKASNSNYKCQLNRVRRRMSKRRSDGQEESPKSAKRKSSESVPESFSTVSNEVSVVDSQTQTLPISQSSKSPEEIEPENKKRRLDYHEGSKDEWDASDTSCSVEDGRLGYSWTIKEDTPGPSRILLTPLNKKERIPVPISFIEQKQEELMQAMMVSPPEKAVKTFSEITNSSPHLDEFPFKICDRCPHCVAIGEEITRLFKMAENSKSVSSKSETTASEEKEFLKIVGITSSSSDMEFYPDTNEPKNIPIMRTSVSYHRTPPVFDQNHWWWDLKCGSIESELSLKIPTWKINEIPPVDEAEEEILEATDDHVYTKRHTKLELDEKRRKKWDIQRIREFRYNEKLRQKLLKQGAMYETPTIESFSGHLHDAESVEVEESLPVNVFGYPVPHLHLEEFDISRMRETVRNSNSSSGKRRGKKV